MDAEFAGHAAFPPDQRRMFSSMDRRSFAFGAIRSIVVVKTGRWKFSSPVVYTCFMTINVHRVAAVVALRARLTGNAVLIRQGQAAQGQWQ